MTMKQISMMAIALLAVIGLGACSPGFSSPDAATESFFNAFEAQDEDAIQDAVCEQLQDRPWVLDTDDNDETNVEFNFDLRYFVDDEGDNTATVDVFGTTRFRVEDANEDFDFRRHSKDEEPLFRVQLEKDGDDWKVCDDSFLPQITGIGGVLTATVD